MVQRTKKQHVVPRFYLEKFCDSDGFVWTHTAGTIPRGLLPEATAVETNFYSPIGANGERYDGIEKLLGIFESGAAPLWGAVSQGEVLSGENREKFALFLAAQYLRSPAIVRAGAEMAGLLFHHIGQVTAANKEVHDKSVDSYEAKTGAKITAEQRIKMRDFISNPNNFTINVLRYAGLPMLGSIGNLADIFLSMKWIVGRSIDQHFITSDSPVTRTSDPATHNRVYGDGAFANKTVRVHFPLSPDRILEMTWQGEERTRVVEIPKEVARKMNGLCAALAERFLYACKSDSGISKLCNKWLDGQKAQKVSIGRETPKIAVKRKL